MRLYLFEHCSLCFRVRMAAALKRLHLQETVVLEDDSGATRTLTAPSPPLAELIARQLSDRERDTVFRDSMAVAQSFARSLLG